MPEELLQRMRDIHYPNDPGWFPPAPGWWLLAALVVAALVWAYIWFRQRHSRQAPYAMAQQLLDQAHSQFSAGTLSPRDYLDTANEILKRLLIHIRHNPQAVDASGAAWLAELDRLHGGNQFSKGPGQWLGDARYARVLPDQLPDLQGLLLKFVKRLQNKPEQTTPAGEAND